MYTTGKDATTVRDPVSKEVIPEPPDKPIGKKLPAKTGTESPHVEGFETACETKVRGYKTPSDPKSYDTLNIAKKLTVAPLCSDADTINSYVVGITLTTEVVPEGPICFDGIRFTSTVAI